VRSLKEVLTIRELLPFTRGQRAEDEIVAQRDRQKETHPANMVLMFGLPLLYTSAAVKRKKSATKRVQQASSSAWYFLELHHQQIPNQTIILAEL